MGVDTAASFTRLSLIQHCLLPCIDIAGWAIGGSCLLVRAGILSDYRDIDLVCTPHALSLLQQRLTSTGWQVLPTTPHAFMHSDRFVRLQGPSGQLIELMAGIKVQHQGIERRWCFSPSRIDWQWQLPWMHLADWCTLYQLFERPLRVSQLLAHLRCQR